MTQRGDVGRHLRGGVTRVDHRHENHVRAGEIRAEDRGDVRGVAHGEKEVVLVRRELAVDAEVRDARRIHRGGIGGGGREDAEGARGVVTARMHDGDVPGGRFATLWFRELEWRRMARMGVG